MQPMGSTPGRKFFLEMLEEILDIRNVQKAAKQVIANKGAGGIDGMQTNELRDYLNVNWRILKTDILEGRYRPQAVLQVEIPKPDGGTRKLGIPTVIDRLLQQAISQWLSPQYEGEFSNSSYGFRPNRNAHQAVLQARAHLNAGYDWVIELDLEKFFDTVNHDKLMGTLAKRISDKRTLSLIRNYLKSGIMLDGVVNIQMEGTPQGSPLSPLLSNIVLDTLDRELDCRGHCYVRYADDCSIYVKSVKSAHRVLGTVTDYIEGKLKLKVNRIKSKVSRARDSTLLGFSFFWSKRQWAIRIAAKSITRIKQKIKLLTRRNNPIPIREKISNLEPVIRGWVNYFSLAVGRRKMEELDGLLRTRLRMSIWKQWRRVRTRVRNLVKLGVTPAQAYEWGNSRKGYCRLAHSPVLYHKLNNKYFASQGYVGFAKHYFWKTEHQTKLF